MKKALFALCSSLVLCLAMSGSSFADEPALNAPDVVKALDENRMKFDLQHKNKAMTIHGDVAKIEEKQGKYILSLSNGEKIPNPFKVIECSFDKPDELLELKTGDSVSVSGTYKGKQSFELGAMTLFKCKLVK